MKQDPTMVIILVTYGGMLVITLFVMVLSLIRKPLPAQDLPEFSMQALLHSNPITSVVVGACIGFFLPFIISEGVQADMAVVTYIVPLVVAVGAFLPLFVSVQLFLRCTVFSFLPALINGYCLLTAWTAEPHFHHWVILAIGACLLVWSLFIITPLLQSIETKRKT